MDSSSSVADNLEREKQIIILTLKYLSEKSTFGLIEFAKYSKTVWDSDKRLHNERIRNEMVNKIETMRPKPVNWTRSTKINTGLNVYLHEPGHLERLQRLKEEDNLPIILVIISDGEFKENMYNLNFGFSKLLAAKKTNKIDKIVFFKVDK